MAFVVDMVAESSIEDLASSRKPESVLSTFHFLARCDRYHTEKPYRMRYLPNTTLPLTNVIVEPREIEIADIRDSIPSLSLDRNGFEVHNLQCDMTREDFSDADKIKEIYLRDLREHLKVTLKAKHVCLLDYQVRLRATAISSTKFAQLRRRHQTFPISTGKEYEHGQPKSLAHIGSYASALVRPGF